jgi:hypothetical protein
VKKNLIIVMMLVVGLLTFSNCSLLGGNKISNEQISDDLLTKTLNGKGGSTLDLTSKYSSHCFQVTESKFNGDSADVKLFFSGTEVLTSGDSIKVVIGDVNLAYKRDGDKWKLDNVDSKDLDIKTTSMTDAMSNFAPLSKPICANFHRSPKF